MLLILSHQAAVQDPWYTPNIEGREFLAFWLDDTGVVLAAMNVNIWNAGDEIAALVQPRTVVDVDALADSMIPLETLLD